MEVLVDRPEIAKNVTRVSGPFVVEATLPAATELDDGADVFRVEDSGNMGGMATRLVASDSDFSTHVDRMLAMLRQSKTLRLPGNRALNMDAIRAITDGEWLHAEAIEQNGTAKRIAIVFGPESGAVTSNLVFEATSEAKHRRYEALYVFGFAVDPKAHEFLHDAKRAGLPATYVAVTPDVAMDDLLKTNRSSEIFSVTGLPDVEVRKSKAKADSKATALWEVEVRGLDVFNPGDMTTGHTEGEHLPCWMLDTDYNGMSFYAAQVFFPKTQAWDNLKRSLGNSLEDSVWDHLAGTVSEPFAHGEHKRIAVKVIDERGNELMVVKELGA
jgi:adenine-specific DNA-methyltransferase